MYANWNRWQGDEARERENDHYNHNLDICGSTFAIMAFIFLNDSIFVDTFVKKYKGYIQDIIIFKQKYKHVQVVE